MNEFWCTIPWILLIMFVAADLTFISRMKKQVAAAKNEANIMLTNLSERIHKLLKELEAEKAKNFDRSQKAMRALESLTVGGSEFVNDVEYCVKYIKRRFDSSNHFLFKMLKRNRVIENELQFLKDNLSEIKRLAETEPNGPETNYSRTQRKDIVGIASLCYTHSLVEENHLEDAALLIVAYEKLKEENKREASK